MTTTRDDGPRQLFEWPGDRRFYLTLDLECDYGTALSENRYRALERIDELAVLVERHDVPMTVFVQTEVLDERPNDVEALRGTDVPVEFHAHSHTHAPRSETSVREEVARSTGRFHEFFGEKPSGYRFPNGKVQSEDHAVLAGEGYEFDACLSPSWRPGHFDRRHEPTTPYRRTDHDIYEVPFTVLSDRLRIPTSLSYCRLVGRALVAVLTRRPSDAVVFNVHMHDLFNSASFADLPPLYRSIYSRNADGLAMLDEVLDTFSGAGFSFERFGTLIEDLPA